MSQRECLKFEKNFEFIKLWKIWKYVYLKNATVIIKEFYKLGHILMATSTSFSMLMAGICIHRIIMWIRLFIRRNHKLFKPRFTIKT